MFYIKVGALVLFGVLFFLSTGWFVWQLRKKHGSDIRVVWYFMFLSVFICMTLGFWARSHGAMGAGGEFIGQYGHYISELMKITLDIGEEMLIFTVIVGVVVVPQLFSYIFSGITGNASKPYMIDGSISFLTWCLVKSFAVASGLIFTLIFFNFFVGWGLEWPKVLFMAVIAMLSIGISFMIVYANRELREFVFHLLGKYPRVLNCFVFIHKFFTRNERVEVKEEVAKQLEDQMEGQVED